MGGSDRCYFFNAVAIIANNNDVKLVETWTVHFANLKLPYRFEKINKLYRDYSCWKILALYCLSPKMPRDIAFIPSILKRVQIWRVSWTRSIVREGLDLISSYVLIGVESGKGPLKLFRITRDQKRLGLGSFCNVN